MNQYEVSVSRVIDAPPEVVYAIFADYHHSHNAILPKPYFTKMTVEKGGTGAGTEITVHMNVMGAKATYHMVVTEPEPGRVLQEEDKEAGVLTTFTVDPVNNGQASKVTLHTRARTAPGVRGFIEKLITPTISRKIYNEELNLVGKYVASGEMANDFQ
ncbi:SRPBCC family protein [Candidatus Leptofilum sp.]|uniref:SRPBCC family protein n=1 Tax=Candidatus Leptofilum sp. TaxID=3241576 RepID=UPI003B5B862E